VQLLEAPARSLVRRRERDDADSERGRSQRLAAMLPMILAGLGFALGYGPLNIPSGRENV
jgi:hypothetical protein